MGIDHIEVCRDNHKRYWHSRYSPRHVEHENVHRNWDKHDECDRHIKACQNHCSDCYFEKLNHVEEITRTYHR